MTEEEDLEPVKKFNKQMGFRWLQVYKKPKAPSNYKHRQTFQMFTHSRGGTYLIDPAGRVLGVANHDEILSMCDEFLGKSN